MDENTVREHAQAHADAVVAGDIKTAGNDLTTDAMQQAPDVMRALPRPTKSASVESVTSEGDTYVARILYSGEDNAAAVLSRWSEQEGRPMITNLELV